jgi:hypothetical protein
LEQFPDPDFLHFRRRISEEKEFFKGSSNQNLPEGRYDELFSVSAPSSRMRGLCSCWDAARLEVGVGGRVSQSLPGLMTRCLLLRPLRVSLCWGVTPDRMRGLSYSGSQSVCVILVRFNYIYILYFLNLFPF